MTQVNYNDPKELERKALADSSGSTFRSRAMQEHTELKQRLDKLKDFILFDGKFARLPDIEQADLKAQLGFMQGYYNVLSKRVSRMCNNA